MAMLAGVDRRKRVAGTDLCNGYPGIGLLRVEFQGAVYTGTASLIAKDRNMVEYMQLTKTFEWPTAAWFELRNNKVGAGFDTMKARHKVTMTAVYPPYLDDPTSSSGFDLAVCWIDVSSDDRVVKDLYIKCGGYTCPALWLENTRPLGHQWLRIS